MRVRVPVCLALVLSAGSAQAAGPIDLFYERSFVRAADQRCQLFERQVAAALAIAAAQAEGAAVRAGVQPKHLASIEQRAIRRAATTACAAPELLAAAARVRNAFDGWSKTVRITFPGATAEWRADRTPTRTLRWRLVQANGAERFGVAGRAEEQAFVALTAASGPKPYAARVVVRDPRRDPKPWLTPGARPASASRAVFAQAATAAEATLLPEGVKGAVAFRFPAETAKALEALDPRESFHVEYLTTGSDGADRVRRVRFEVGDFTAANAFLALSAPGSTG